MQWANTGLSVYQLINSLKLLHHLPLSTWWKMCSQLVDIILLPRTLILLQDWTSALCPSCQPCFPRTGLCPTAATWMAGAYYMWGISLHYYFSWNYEVSMHLGCLSWKTVHKIGHLYVHNGKRPQLRILVSSRYLFWI